MAAGFAVPEVGCQITPRLIFVRLARFLSALFQTDPRFVTPAASSAPAKRARSQTKP